jgi:hypothetical protein
LISFSGRESLVWPGFVPSARGENFVRKTTGNVRLHWSSSYEETLSSYHCSIRKSFFAISGCLLRFISRKRDIWLRFNLMIRRQTFQKIGGIFQGDYGPVGSYRYYGMIPNGALSF